MDVAKTIEDDISEEEKERTIHNLKRETAERQHHEKAVRKYEES